MAPIPWAGPQLAHLRTPRVVTLTVPSALMFPEAQVRNPAQSSRSGRPPLLLPVRLATSFRADRRVAVASSVRRRSSAAGADQAAAVVTGYCSPASGCHKQEGGKGVMYPSGLPSCSDWVAVCIPDGRTSGIVLTRPIDVACGDAGRDQPVVAREIVSSGREPDLHAVFEV